MPNRPAKYNPRTSFRSSGGSTNRTGGGILGYLTGANKLKTVEDEEGNTQYAARRPFLDALLNRGNASAAAMNYNITNQQQMAQQQMAQRKAEDLAIVQHILRGMADKEAAKQKLADEQAMVDYKNKKELELLPQKESATTKELVERKRREAELQQSIDAQKILEEQKRIGTAAMLARNPSFTSSSIISPESLGLMLSQGQKLGEGGKGIQDLVQSGQITGAMQKNPEVVPSEFINKLLAGSATSLNTIQKMNDETAFMQGNPNLVRMATQGDLANRAIVKPTGFIPSGALPPNLLSLNPSTTSDVQLPIDKETNPFGTRTQRQTIPASITPAGYGGTADQSAARKLSEQDLQAASGFGMNTPSGTEQKTAPTIAATDQVELQELLRRLNILRANLPSAPSVNTVTNY